MAGSIVGFSTWGWTRRPAIDRVVGFVDLGRHPAGERAWAPGWDPVYPAEEDTSPGTTFTTHEGRTFWVIADRTPTSMRYARITPGVHAGTVEVRCEPAGEATLARVTYDLTGLADPVTVDGFAEDFPAMLAEWERLISASLS